MTLGEAKDRLARLLGDIPTMQSDHDRGYVISQMAQRGCPLVVNAASGGAMQCLQIIDSAVGQRHGLHQLAHLITLVDRTPTAETFVAAVEELLPTDLFLLEERFRLLAELGPHVPQSELMDYYLSALSGPYQDVVADPPPPFAGLADLVCELEQVVGEEPGHPLVRLIECIAERSRQRKVPKAAFGWSDRLARRMDEDAREPVPGPQQRYLADRRSAKAAPRLLTTGRAALVLRLEGSGPRPTELFGFTAWLYLGRSFKKTLYVNDAPMDLDRVRLTLMEVMERAFVEARQLDPAKRWMDLEFAVPREMLCYPFEEWKLPDHEYATLAENFVVVVRDLKRQGGLVRYVRESKWEHLTRNGHVPPTEIYLWITCDDEPHAPRRLYNLLKTEDGVSLGLTFPPRNSPHTIEIAEALEAGTPVAVWPRCCSDMASGPNGAGPANVAFQEELSRRMADRPITDLPMIVLEMRQQLASTGPTWAGLTLLWDDPWRWPPDPHFSLGVPESAKEAM